MEITARVGKDEGAPKVTVQYDMPASLADLATKFGEDVVYNKAVDAIIIDIQAGMRRHMVDKTDKDGKLTTAAKSAEEIQAWVNEYSPSGRSVVRQTIAEKALAAVKTMTPEQRAALLKELQAAA